MGIDLPYAFANISAHINAGWYIGMPFNDTFNPRLAITEYSQQILGKSLLGVQAGNEPDLYAVVRVASSRRVVFDLLRTLPNSMVIVHKITA